MTEPKFRIGQRVFFNPITKINKKYDGVGITLREYEWLATAEQIVIQDVYTDDEHDRYKYPAYWVRTDISNNVTVAECMLIGNPKDTWAQKGD